MSSKNRLKLSRGCICNSCKNYLFEKPVFRASFSISSSWFNACISFSSTSGRSPSITGKRGPKVSPTEQKSFCHVGFTFKQAVLSPFSPATLAAISPVVPPPTITRSYFLPFLPSSKVDDLVKSHETDDTVKSSRCKAHESLGTRRTCGVVCIIGRISQVLSLRVVTGSIKNLTKKSI